MFEHQVDMFGPSVGFIKFKADCVHRASNDTNIPGIVFMRGHSVGILMELTAEESKRRYIVLTKQPRFAVPHRAFLEIPAGMVDGDGGFVGQAATKVKEKTGIEIKGGGLVELTGHDAPIGMSCGISDEAIKLFLYRKVMPDAAIQELQGVLSGCEQEGERIVVQVIPIEDLKHQLCDGKSLAALALHEGMPMARDEEHTIEDVYTAVNKRHDNKFGKHEPLLVEGSHDPALTRLL